MGKVINFDLLRPHRHFDIIEDIKTIVNLILAKTSHLIFQK